MQWKKSNNTLEWGPTRDARVIHHSNGKKDREKSGEISNKMWIYTWKDSRTERWERIAKARALIHKTKNNAIQHSLDWYSKMQRKKERKKREKYHSLI